MNLMFYRKFCFGRQSPWLSVSSALILVCGLSFHFLVILFVTVSFLHLNCPLIGSYECLSSGLFERFMLLSSYVAGSFERFRLYVDLQLYVFILSVNCKFFFYLWSRFSVLRVPVDLWLSFLYVHFRERSTVFVRFRLWLADFLVYFCL